MYDNFIKRGYSGSDIDCGTNSAGKTLREAVKDAVYQNRRDPIGCKLGAHKYTDLRQEFPRSGKVEMPQCDPDLISRPQFAKLFRNCSNMVMRARPELVAYLGTKPKDINAKEMNEICDIFMRCNHRNTAQIPDLKGFCTFFGEVNLRAKWPSHHELLKGQLDSVLAQVAFSMRCVCDVVVGWWWGLRCRGWGWRCEMCILR